MPSPFPGMDPYLEGPLWMTVHTQLSAEIARQLAPKLRPKYLALTTERFVLADPDSVAVATANVYPDVRISAKESVPLAGPAASVAVASLQLATRMPTRIPHVTVEIRDTAHRQLVTAIEVLSPTNKRAVGYEEYVAKRQRLLLSTAHLMEIDLLRNGQRVPMQEPLPAAPYFVFVSRAEKRPVIDVWPISMASPLPTVGVPLLSGDDDVPLDLQLALTNVYDLLGYDLAIDYSEPPPVPLPEDSADWLEAILRSK